MPASRKKTSKSRSDCAVQGTNDSSIVSKFAMVQSGYFDDKYLQYMVQKTKARRSPLINRGYYIRAKAIDTLIREFLVKFGPDCQVISLGAGFDTTFFRLSHQKCLPTETSFIEIDFREVANRKARLIRNESELWTHLSRDDCPPIGENGPEVLCGGNYKLLAVDLSNLALLEACWRHLTSKDKHTLLLSECVMTYMSPKSSSAVIASAADYFTNAVFLTYEQIYPHDAFGRVMCSHFRRLGSPLKGIEQFPNPIKQEQRYTDAKWTTSHCIPMTYFYQNIVATDERNRIRTLELFDEYEEWHLKCGHYVIVCSEKGQCCGVYKNFTVAKSEIMHSLDVSSTVELFPVFSGLEGLSRFGHDLSVVSQFSGTVQFSDDNDILSDDVVLTGGFGDSGGGKHSRDLCHILLDFRRKSTRKVEIIGDNVIDRRMFHSTASIGEKQILIFGGRTSPSVCFNDVIILHIDDQSATTTHSGQSEATTGKSTGWFESLSVIGCKPCERFRHASILVKKEGYDHFYVIGGRTACDKLLDDCFFYDVRNRAWTKVASLPSPRCSARLAQWGDYLVLCGGLDSDENPMSDILFYNVHDGVWTNFKTLQNLQPRYSQTCHVVGDELYMIGGVSFSYPQPLLTRVNLLTGAVREYRNQVTLEEPLMLHNHASLEVKVARTGSAVTFLIIGGGGNCFSFGTHLNTSSFLMSVGE